MVGERNMHCPKCVRISLKTKKVKTSKVVVDVCSNCSGIWFDANELNGVLLVASKDMSLPKDAEDTGITCPRCRVPLKGFNYPQTYVKIDMCPECQGLWLNAGEFKEIKIVREHLEDKGKLEAYAPVVGVKGELLTWINSAIKSLYDFK